MAKMKRADVEKHMNPGHTAKKAKEMKEMMPEKKMMPKKMPKY